MWRRFRQFFLFCSISECLVVHPMSTGFLSFSVLFVASFSLNRLYIRDGIIGQQCVGSYYDFFCPLSVAKFIVNSISAYVYH